VHDRRLEALEQLGYAGSLLTPQKHQLKTIQGQVVPFPVNHGTAIVVLVSDGRTRGLRLETKYKTPKRCRTAASPRDCWSCLEETHHAVVVTMRNSPRYLSLGTFEHDDQGAWFRAYERWAQALGSRESNAARATSRELETAVVAWSERAHDVEPRRTVLGFWGSYLRSANRGHGFEIASDLTAVPDLDLASEFVRGVETSDPPLVRESNVDHMRAMLRRPADERVLGRYSMVVGDARPGDETLGVRIAEDFVTFNLLSKRWWSREGIGDAVAAAATATRLLSLISKLVGLDAAPRVASLEAQHLRPAGARVGDSEVLLGWVPRVSTRGAESLLDWMLRWEPLWLPPSGWASWPVLLALGDPRVRLRVHPDGRADLRVERSALLAD